MISQETILILAGALAGGFVSGLTGFGTGLTALPLWLLAVPPTVAAQLVSGCSVASQIQTLPAIWPLIRWRSVTPFIIAGLIGVPAGVWVLPHIDPRHFKLGVGGLLVLYCGFMALNRDALRVRGGGAAADAGIGLVAGFLGGVAGLSGALVTVWAGLRGLEKDAKRALFQSFNLTILAAMLIVSAGRGLMTREFFAAFVLALPGTLVGSRLGHWLYRRLDNRRFDIVVLALLLASGLLLLWTNR